MNLALKREYMIRIIQMKITMEIESGIIIIIRLYTIIKKQHQF